jgi:hypothetical protein
MISNAADFRREAARASRLAKKTIDALTQERPKSLAAEYLTQAAELESGGQKAPPEVDPTE